MKFNKRCCNTLITQPSKPKKLRTYLLTLIDDGMRDMGDGRPVQAVIITDKGQRAAVKHMCKEWDTDKDNIEVWHINIVTI